MGQVHFVHGNPKAPKISSVKTIDCPNTNCDRELSSLMVLNGKKVCPYCKCPIPENLVKELETRQRS